MERHTNDPGMVGALDLLQRLVAGGAVGVGNQPGDHDDLRIDLHPLGRHAVVHLVFQRTHLVEDVDHLAAGIGASQHVVLAEVAVRRQDQQARNHRNAREKGLQHGGRRRLQNVDQHPHGLACACCRGAPAGLEAQPAEHCRQRGPRRLGVERFELPQRFAQRILQLRHLADVRRKHQLLAVDLVHAQKIHELGLSRLGPGEHRARQRPVEMQYALPDRACFLQPRYMAAKRLEVDFQRAVAVIRRPHQLFLEGEKFAHRHALRHELFLMHAQIAPAAGALAQREVGPWRLEHAFLEMPHCLLQGGAVERRAGGVGSQGI